MASICNKIIEGFDLSLSSGVCGLGAHAGLRTHWQKLTPKLRSVLRVSKGSTSLLAFRKYDSQSYLFIYLLCIYFKSEGRVIL